MDPDKTPDIGRGLQKITEDIILVTDCLRTSGQRRSSWSQETQIRTTGRVESKTASEISKDEKISEDENQSEMHSDAINDGRSDRSIGTLSKEKRPFFNAARKIVIIVFDDDNKSLAIE